MDWSIGQDDEAAESVRPRASGSGAAGESTVVVDPVSQIPDPIPRFRREPVEKTEVLKGRRVDELRAEVQRKRKAQQREQHKRLALWGAAGAGAVILGALLAGLMFSGPSGAASANQASAAATSGSQPQVATPQVANPVVEDEAAPQPPRAEPSQELASSGTLSLDDLPSE